MKSKLNSVNINYPESKEMDPEDVGYASTLYEDELFGLPIHIALGKEKYTYSRYDVIYYFIYLIVDFEPKTKIGVFEIDSNQLINVIDEDGDVDLSKGNILLFVTEEYIRKVVNENKTKPNDNEIDEIEKGNIEVDVETYSNADSISTIDEQVDDDDVAVMRLRIPSNKLSSTDATAIANKSLKEDIFNINQNANPPSSLMEETLEQADDIKRGYTEQPRHNWMVKFMKNENYGIIDNEGGGDCFFAVIRDAFKQNGKETTVDKLRALLSKELTEETFKQTRTIYLNFLAEFQDKERDLKDIKKTMQILKKRCNKTLEKCENDKIVKEAKELLEKHKEVMQDKAETKTLLSEFQHMEGIDSLEKYKQFIMTHSYWADTWAVSTLERLLNIKIIILSEESYKSKDLDSVLNCGQLNDADLEKQGQFKPDFYILTCYTGFHYKLVTYKNKHIFTFREIPYDIKILIINKCMERNAGPYYLIEDFRKLKTKLGLSPNEGEPVDDDDEYLSKDLYEKDVVFMFHSNSNKDPKAGRGSGEKINETRVLEFNSLNKITDWRKILDDSWPAPFTIDGNRWNSVEHYWLGSQFKKGFPDFYMKFSLNSESDISKDLTLARAAGGKTGKLKDKILRDRKVKFDPDFYAVGVNPRSKEERVKALTAKFKQNLDLGAVLRDTKMAKLVHFVRSREPEVDDLLMKVRKEVR